MDPTLIGNATVAVFQTVGVVACVYIFYRGLKIVGAEIRPSLSLSPKELKETLTLEESRH